MFHHFQSLAKDIKLSHSVFALPFALLGMFLAAGSANRLPRWGEAGLILWCMVCARSFAMLTNRWADQGYDALNPRTAGRAIPSGKLSSRVVLIVALLCAAGLVLGASGFLAFGNPWPLIASPLVLAWLASYSYAKRWTWLCHLILGSALAISPIAATLAIEPGYLLEPTVYLLGVMITGWVAGFDVIYALQDTAIDRQQGLYSMPANLGEIRALWISRLLHAMSMMAIVLLWWLEPQLGVFFFVGMVVVVALLVLEHGLVWGSKTHHINMAFFTVNGVISLLLGALGIVDVWMALRR